MDLNHDQSPISESVRQVVIAVRALADDGQPASLARLAEYLTLADPSAALMRCQRAEHLGLIRNVEPSPDRLPIYELTDRPLPSADRRRRPSAFWRWMRHLAAGKYRQPDRSQPLLLQQHDDSNKEDSQ